MPYYRRRKSVSPRTQFRKLSRTQLKNRIQELDQEIKQRQEDIPVLKSKLKSANAFEEQVEIRMQTILDEERRSTGFFEGILKKRSPWLDRTEAKHQAEREIGGENSYPFHIRASIEVNQQRIQECQSLKQAAEEVLAVAEKKYLREKKQEDKQKQKAALVAAHLKKGRKLASSVKKQLQILEYCPYCNGPIGEDPHADHIYPLSMGGLSVEENMVFVCRECNQTKTDKTLREFIQENNLDRDQIERALEKLGKKF